MVAMKVQLIVVQGKSEGRTIPLSVPVFRIGRGETCHLRPNSERVSREHAELIVQGDSVTVRDLGSRNGTLVNGKALTQPVSLKDRDIVQVGPLSFMVSVRDELAGPDEPGPGVVPPAELNRDTAAALQLAENASNASAMRSGETILIPAFFDLPGSPTGAATADDANDDEYERHPIVDGDTVLDMPATGTAGAASESAPASASGTSSAAKKTKAVPGTKRTSDAASEILRKMMERGRVSR